MITFKPQSIFDMSISTLNKYRHEFGYSSNSLTTPLLCPKCNKTICRNISFYCPNECKLFKNNKRKCLQFMGSCKCNSTFLESQIIKKYFKNGLPKILEDIITFKKRKKEDIIKLMSLYIMSPSYNKFLIKEWLDTLFEI